MSRASSRLSEVITAMTTLTNFASTCNAITKKIEEYLALVRQHRELEIQMGQLEDQIANNRKYLDQHYSDDQIADLFILRRRSSQL